MNTNNIVYFERANVPNEDILMDKVRAYLKEKNALSHVWENNYFSWNKVGDADKDALIETIPELGGWLADNNLICTRMAVIRVAPQSKENLHIDIGMPYGLNFPLENVDDTHTCFFQDKDGGDLLLEEKLHFYDQTQNGKSVNYWHIHSELKEATRVTVSQATWLKVNEPHLIENFTDNVRLTLSLRFKELPDRFKQYPDYPRTFINQK